MSCCHDLAAAIEVLCNFLGLIHESQARSEGTDKWNSMKLDTTNGQHNMIIYEGLVYCLYGADYRVIVIPDDIELKQWLMYDHQDSPTSGYLGAYHIIESSSS